MRDLLFLCHRLPYPPDKGDKIRAWHMLRHLAQRHRVHLGTFVDDPADWDHVAFLRGICASVGAFGFGKARQKARAIARLRPGRALTLDYFHQPRLQEWVDKTIAANAIERTFVFSSGMAPYALRHAGLSGVLDMVDVDSAKWTEYAARARFPLSAVWAREGRTLLSYERIAAHGFDHTLFVSEEERAKFAALAPDIAARTQVIANGVDIAHFSAAHDFASPFGAAQAIVFTGTMDYWPNIDAASWFAREVLPRLGGRAEFFIVGANAGAEARRLADLPGVHVTGRVPDTRPYLAHAAVAVAPLRIALGVQNKVLEAMAMGRPVVVSPQALEGVQAVPDRDLLVAQDAEGWARAIGAILDGRHADLGAHARRAMERGYDWDTNLAALDALLGDPAPVPAREAAEIAQ
jgi:sugar transferase (PEP-CTERM/EpsH1 system associated)